MVDPDKAKEEIDSNLSCDTTLLQSPKKCALSQKLCLVEKLSQQNPVLQNFKILTFYNFGIVPHQRDMYQNAISVLKIPTLPLILHNYHDMRTFESHL